MNTFTPSPYQARFFEFVEHGTGSAIVNAVAGSGKSTTIVRSLLHIPERLSVQIFAFNAAIAAEMKEKIAKLAEEEGRNFRNFAAATFHSKGYAAVLKHLGKKYDQVKPDGSKVRNLLKAKLIESDYEAYGDFCAKLVGLAKGEGIGAICPDVESAWYALISHHDMYLDHEDATEERAVEIARKTLRLSNEVAKNAILDFDDQLYLPLLWKLRLWQNDLVFVDEAQDTNPVRRAFVKLTLRPGGRLIAVGDRRQAIYGFTGASHDAMDLIEREFNCVEMPLTVSYRCPKAVVPMVRELVPHFEVNESNREGRVLSLPLDDALKLLGPSDAILCRQTAPLVELAFRLIGQGVGCTVLGKDIGGGLVNLIKKMRAVGIDRLRAKLEAFAEREVARHTAKGEEAKAEAVSDRVASIMTVIEGLPETGRTVPALIARIESMFSDTSGVLTLSTIHKAKGREFDVVGDYCPELCPSKWARQEHQHLQELNLLYVKYTRCKKTYITINDAVERAAKRKECAEVVS